MNGGRSLWRVFRWPLAIGVASLAGLLSALLADGGWDAVSWAALAVPVAVGAWHWGRRPSAASKGGDGRQSGSVPVATPDSK